jgi:agmatinase
MSSRYKRDVMPFYGGLPSFFRLPAIDFDDISEGMAVVAGVPIDNGIYGGRLGARLGPKAIREASMFTRAGYELAPGKTRVNLDTERATRLKDSLLIGDLGDYNIYPTDLMKTTESVIQGVGEVVARGGFSVVMGGDHYVTYPAFEGFAKGMAERKEGIRLGHIHIDAHSDFNESNALGGRYHHGTMVRRISENPAISYKNLAWVGINSPVTLDQFDLKRSHNLKMLTAQNVRERGMTEVMQEAMDTAADGTDAVYASIDIDVIDAHESTGTGSPEFVGVSTADFFEAMDMLSRYDKLGAFDLCEVSPQWDPSGQTERIAADAMIRVLHKWLFDVVKPGT